MPRPIISPELRERLFKVARAEPDMTHAALGARFGLSPGTVTNLLSKAGIRREHVALSDTSGQTRGDLKRAIAKHKRSTNPGGNDV